MTTKAKPPTTAAVAETNDKMVEFVPFGASDAIRLSAAMVRQFIAVPTRSGALPSERDCIKFIMLCRGKRANPFEGDCFLIGYDSQNGPSFSMVCGIELFLKRAEQSVDYDGRESGVIIQTADAALVERPGALVLDGEKLVGGWAKVYRKNHGRPEYKAVKFSTYNTDKSRWAKDPGGQIEKVALSQALRQAYPTALGGLYTQEEMQRVTEAGDNVMQIREPIALPQDAASATSGPAPAASEPGNAEEPPPFDRQKAIDKIIVCMGEAPRGTVSRALKSVGATSEDWQQLDDTQIAELLKLLEAA